jgi:hypothetical protein
MAGIEGLGRVFNVIHTADTVGFNLSATSAVSFIVKASGASSVALTAATTYAGSYTNFTTAAGFGQTTRWYQSTTATGTAAWTKQTASWSTATITLAATTGYVSVFTVFGSQMADGYHYLKATCTNATVVALLHDLTVQRAPANLAILGA